jgi:hypothetical protein
MFASKVITFQKVFQFQNVINLVTVNKLLLESME